MDRKSDILWVWAAPGASEALPKGGGLRPPPCARVSGAPGAAQTPKTTDFRPLTSYKVLQPSKVQPRLGAGATAWSIPKTPGCNHSFSSRVGPETGPHQAEKTRARHTWGIWLGESGRSALSLPWCMPHSGRCRGVACLCGPRQGKRSHGSDPCEPSSRADPPPRHCQCLGPTTRGCPGPKRF
jgi:hypothetical protein